MMHSSTDVTQPEREPLRFAVDTEGATPEVQEMVNHIKQVSESILFHWKTFPLILPLPLTSQQFDGGGDSGEGVRLSSASTGSNKPFYVRDLFLAPSFDELDAVAVDAKGEPRRLSEKQLDAVRLKGDFEVESVHFPGQYHRWRLSILLQKGNERAHETLLDDVARAAEIMVVGAKGRIFDSTFSLLASFSSFIDGLSKLLDIVIGVPSVQPQQVDEKIGEERSMFLVTELVCKPECEDLLESMCGFVHHQIKKALAEKYSLEGERLPSPPYLFQTPKGIELDLRLFDRDLMSHVLSVVSVILEKEARGWFVPFREKTLLDLKSKQMTEEMVQTEANKAVMDAYLRRVYKNILNHADLQALGVGIPQLLVEQAQAIVIMHRSVENVQRKLSKLRECERKEVHTLHPILSRISHWMKTTLEQRDIEYALEYQWSAHEESLALCRASDLHQAAYFLNRDLAFMREHEPVLLQELLRVRNPTRTFHWRTQIWSPRKWVVRRHFQGKSEVIPTVLSDNATSITNPRADPSQPVFLVERDSCHSTSTRWPFWRWANYCHRTWSWTWNAMFFFGVVIPWCSPVSFRALFCIEPFMPDLELSQVNGTLFPRRSSSTKTLCSRLLSLWRHVSKARTQFETRADTGFIGKGFTRHLNRLWNCVLKGLFGTLGIITIFPPLCLLVSISGLFIASSAILWMPVVTLLLHSAMVLIYDIDSPLPSSNRICIILQAILWKIGLLGLVQPIGAFLVAAFLCPIAAGAVLLMGAIRRGFRWLWDGLLFHLVIKKQGHIPSSDGFLVKRVAGPGMAAQYFYQIRPEQALAALEARLETELLTAYHQQTEEVILQPQKAFISFVNCSFNPFSAQLSSHKEGVYGGLLREAQELSNSLSEKVEKRKRDLQTGISVGVRSRVRMSHHDIKLILQHSVCLLEQLYPREIFPRLPTKMRDHFWESKGLLVEDWAGLTALLYSEIFSPDFLTPLEETDMRFHLEVQHINLSRYVNMLRSSDYRDDLDVSSAVHTPKGNIRIQSPHLEINSFNPYYRCAPGSIHTPRRNTQRNRSLLHIFNLRNGPSLPSGISYSADNLPKLSIPLPIPHPSLISLIIYNREARDPSLQIPIEWPLCQNILKSIQEGNSRSHGSTAGNSTTAEGADSVDCDTESRTGPTSVHASLASPEDISLEVEAGRAAFSTYGTTV